jgi:signal transduction histidine kinase
MSHHGFDARAARHWTRVQPGHQGVCAQALARGERILIEDVRAADDVVGPADQELYRALGIRAVQSTPLRSRVGELIGMLSTHWGDPHAPSERDLRLLDIVARQAADLLERRQAEEERESLLERERLARLDAERAGRIKDEFLATLSHELRTPLHAVIGWSQILKRDLSDPEKVRSAVEIIERNGRLQAQLITDLLDISRILSGNMSLDLQPVELSTVVRTAVESITPAAQSKGLELHLDVEPLSEMVQGDPARLQQVVWNLLTNAVKFTPRGGAIRVALSMAGRQAQIRVSDDGRGIEPEFLPHVFERFRQADASAARAYGGLGLGLAIVKQFVELHGGQVRAESAGPDRGATFTVELPLRPREIEPGILRPMSTSARRHAPSRALQGLNVLLVDDEPDALAMVRRFLEESGARVGAAASVDAALELAALERFDVVVSDIAMPDRDGFALIEELRARGLQLPAAALTAFARPEDRERALGAGFQCHVSKPIEPADLIAAVARLGGIPPLVMSEGV